MHGFVMLIAQSLQDGLQVVSAAQWIGIGQETAAFGLVFAHAAGGNGGDVCGFHARIIRADATYSKPMHKLLPNFRLSNPNKSPNIPISSGL